MTTSSVSPVREQLFVPSFERHLRAENKSHNTVLVYSSAIRDFGDFLESHGMPTVPDHIRREHVESFIDWLLHEKGAKPATANNRYRGLQSYFGWLVSDGEIKDSPMARMKPPRVPETPPPVLTDEQIGRLFKQCDGQDFTGRRDTAILRLLIDSGMRRGELAGLTLSDLDLDRGTARVTGKGSRVRQVSFGKKATRDLDRYLRVRAQHKDAALPNLWLGQHGPITPNGVYQIVTAIAQRARVKAYTHLFRHTSAHLWLSAEGSETNLMAHMGWRSRSMLQRYGASMLEQRAQDEHKRLGLGDRF